MRTIPFHRSRVLCMWPSRSASLPRRLVYHCILLCCTGGHRTTETNDGTRHFPNSGNGTGTYLASLERWTDSIRAMYTSSANPPILERIPETQLLRPLSREVRIALPSGRTFGGRILESVRTRLHVHDTDQWTVSQGALCTHHTPLLNPRQGWRL